MKVKNIKLKCITGHFNKFQQFFHDIRCALIHINSVVNRINVDESTSSVVKKLLRHEENLCDSLYLPEEVKPLRFYVELIVQLINKGKGDE